MATAKRRHDREMLICQREIIGSLFDGKQIDVYEFVARGALARVRPHRLPAELQADVDRGKAKVAANGGKLIIEDHNGRT
jgi:hypothetical protein